MDLGPWTLAKLVVSRLPLILKLAITNRLGISPCADKQDSRTEIVVAILKSTLTGKQPLGKFQAASLKDPGVKGQLWIATATCPAPDNEVREAVIRGIKELGNGTETYDLPDTADVQGEWTGYQAGVDQKTPRPQLSSEKEHYENMMKEVTSPVTVLYFHGGAYIVMDPISHRPITQALAKRTGGRCFSVRYRLAPQTAFPGQLVDALTAYLYLQAPPPGAFHEPVAPKNIVFAGDSAGGHLSFSLMLLLLTLRRAGITSIRFHGRDVPLELPAGVTGNSPWFDVGRSLPSVSTNAKYDYLEPPLPTGLPKRTLPPDDVWPTRPPRTEMFCRASTTTHPLCSPLSATSDMWKGAPPVFMCVGNEGLEDEIAVVARRIHLAGAAVEYAGYEGQPHCFAMIFPTTPAGKDCLDRWVAFIKDAVQGDVQIKDEGRWLKAKSSPLQWRFIKLSEMGIDDGEVRKRTEERKAHAMEREKHLVQEFENGGRAKL